MIFLKIIFSYYCIVIGFLILKFIIINILIKQFMKLKTIYLAGAINGLTYPETTEWRNEVKYYANKNNMQVLDPMRGKEFLNIDMDKPIDDSQLGVEISSKEIFLRDINDVKKSNIVVINLNHIKNKKYIGSNFELGYAFALDKPIYSLNLPFQFSQHPFYKESIIKNFDSPKDFVKYIKNND